MTNYVSVHGERGFFVGGLLGSPVPPSGSLGSLRLSGSFPVQIRVGDKITVSTSGVTYVYYSSVELLTGYAWSAFVAVFPAIQTAHAVSDTVRFTRLSVGKMQAMNAIVSANCNSADISVPGAVPNRRRGVLPWVRDWPWATDPYGLSWDQSNIMSLLLKPVYNSVDFDNPTAGQPWNVPVPRAIGSEYEKFSPRLLGQALGDYREGATEGVGPGLSDYDVLFPNENRAADSVSSRATLPLLRGYPLRLLWFPRPQIFSFDVADADTVPNGSISPLWNERINSSYMSVYQWSLIRMASDRVTFSAEKTVALGVGSRGGRYSVCGYFYDNATGSPGPFAVEVRAIVPGLGDVLIHSIACTSGAVAYTYGPVVTGTWSGVVVPTDLTGTCAEFYVLVRVPNDGSIRLTYGSNIVVADSTQVPWAHHVVTGNLVAPGGLIAPFY